MHLRVIRWDDNTGWDVWAGLEDDRSWSDQDFIDQPYSFIVGQGETIDIALGKADAMWKRAWLRVQGLQAVTDRCTCPQFYRGSYGGASLTCPVHGSST